jgi:hypothetical protein
LSTPSGAPLTPQAWCRRILTSLSQRNVQDREAGYLEMLLTYFIELDPPADLFGDLLSKYVSDQRADIAEAAGLLQRSWLRGRAATATGPLPGQQEVLRTLGGRLDDAGARGAYLAVGPEGVRLQILGEPSVVILDLGELRQEIAGRTALRGQVAPADPSAPDRFETRLRAVGMELDRLVQAQALAAAHAYELVALRRTVVVEGEAGYHRVFLTDELGEILRVATSQPSA